jgi:hypothetical protein
MIQPSKRFAPRMSRGGIRETLNLRYLKRHRVSHTHRFDCKDLSITCAGFWQRVVDGSRQFDVIVGWGQGTLQSTQGDFSCPVGYVMLLLPEDQNTILERA